MSRIKMAAGNWKMNNGVKAAVDFVNQVIPAVKDSNNEVVLGVPFVCIPDVAKLCAGTNVKVAAQNMYFKDSGAFTGEVSGPMLAELGVSYVIIGHSERREYFNETDETVNLKAEAVFAHGMTPIICCGETLEQRELGIKDEWIRMQIKLALKDLTAEQVSATVIAYEPIWAIGTGVTATSEQAQEVCHLIRECVAELYSREVADAVRVLYGGSVKASNCKELFGMADIDGGLVGGASLKIDEWQAISNC